LFVPIDANQATSAAIKLLSKVKKSAPGSLGNRSAFLASAAKITSIPIPRNAWVKMVQIEVEGDIMLSSFDKGRSKGCETHA
jgi:hypothetical protein